MSYKVRQPVGTKLARPAGSGLKGPAGGLKKPSGIVGQPLVPSGVTKKVPGAVRQGQMQPPGGAGGVAQPPKQAPPPAATEPSEMEVGDRVLVGGVKPGTIAFLGPTQFARGVWAGVVLDTKEGKNNGCVNGVQYFECEPNRGLFARPEKLTVLPRPHKTSNAIGHTKSPQVKTTPPTEPGAPPTFSVGDQVVVEGGKQGVVGFFGTTEFARGVWVGVVLDTPEGKNNGVVAGVQYFQCRPNHGLFTRPQKLTLVEKERLSAQPGQPGGQRASLEPEPPSRGSSQQRSTQSTPVMDLKALRDKLKIGDRVLVGGAKEGFLRYLGPTEFAKGIWAGVELEEPLGKNNGAVSGKRYFQCPPKHGLFAPLPKVEKLADSGPPPDEALPPTQPSPKHGAKQHVRQLSNSSSGSFGSGRPPVDTTPSSSLHGSTAAGLSQLLQEKEATIASLQAALQAREMEGRELGDRITELTRQVEDLQFQLEEQGVISGDRLECVEEGTQTRVVELEAELRGEREASNRLREQLQRLEVTSEESGRDAYQQAEVLSRQLEEREEEVAQLKKSLDSARATNADVQRQVRSGEDLVQQLTADKARLEGQLTQLSELSGDSSQQVSYLQQQLQDKERQMEELYSKQVEIREEAEKAKDDFKFALERFQAETQQSTGSLSKQLQEAHKKIEELTSSLRQSQEAAASERSKCGGLELELSQAERTVGELRGEVASVKQDLQDALELCNEHETLMEERNRELAAGDAEIRSLKVERESWSNERSRLIAEQQHLASERDQAIAECDRLMARSANTTSEQSELSRQRQQLMAERDQLVAERQAQRTENEKVVTERDALLHSLKELQQQRQDVMGQSREMNIKYDSMQEALSEAQAESERLKLQLLTANSRWEQEQSALQEQIELARAGSLEVQQRIERMAGERDSALNKAQEMADRLVEAERDRDSLQEVVVKANREIEKLQDELEDISKSHQVLEHEVASESTVLQQRLEVMEDALGERERELAEARERIESLTDELVISQGKRDQVMLEEEKELLEERVRELTIQLEKAEKKHVTPAAEDFGNMDAGTLAVQLGEAHDQLESTQQSLQDSEQQVDFLNSVIADLQQKLEAAESLALMPPGELGIEEEDDLEQLPPPRLFCDICDQFDLHDTDDCPLQAASDSPPPTMYHGKRAPGGSDRPYCNNCEVFGHWTEECEYDVTY